MYSLLLAYSKYVYIALLPMYIELSPMLSVVNRAFSPSEKIYVDSQDYYANPDLPQFRLLNGRLGNRIDQVTYNRGPQRRPRPGEEDQLIDPNAANDIQDNQPNQLRLIKARPYGLSNRNIADLINQVTYNRGPQRRPRPGEEDQPNQTDQMDQMDQEDDWIVVKNNPDF